MKITCPRCGAFNPIEKNDALRLPLEAYCTGCNVKIIVKGKKGSRKPEKIVIANSSQRLSLIIDEILTKSGFVSLKVGDGSEVMRLVEADPPALILLDVAISGLCSFEVIDLIRRNETIKWIKIILLASIFDKAKYKRAPVSLYGADDYIEIHHLHDQLIPKINAVLPGTAGTKNMGLEKCHSTTSEGRVADKIKDIVKKEVKIGEDQRGSVAHGAAKRLARIIASDICLYNQDLVQKGIRMGNLYELLEDEIKEGKIYYAKRVPESIRKNTSYLKDSFQEIVNKMKKEMGV